MLSRQKPLLPDPPVDLDDARFDRDADAIRDDFHVERGADDAHGHVARAHRERALRAPCHLEVGSTAVEPKTHSFGGVLFDHELCLRFEQRGTRRVAEPN